DLQRVFRMKAEAVARQVDDLGLDFAGLAMHSDRKFGINAWVPGEQLMPLQNRFMFHVTSTSTRAPLVHSGHALVPPCVNLTRMVDRLLKESGCRVVYHARRIGLRQPRVRPEWRGRASRPTTSRTSASARPRSTTRSPHRSCFRISTGGCSTCSAAASANASSSATA